jgi:hypothetical protein
MHGSTSTGIGIALQAAAVTENLFPSTVVRRTAANVLRS